MNKHEAINYLELPAKDISATKAFFTTVFKWTFVDYGPEYSAFSDAGVEGGFYQSDLMSTTLKGSALIVFYSDKLEQTQAKVEQAGGAIIKPIFTFPGGRRFHFIEPSGNEFAVWSDKE
ncbi:VOC family protein [Photobacterium sanguinicancri]|uniref:VOC family protein n=1 Tax=Photobacterium sanguinicancri TaxID=875932 RepID=A0AAW7Y0Q2_9GAMM|nr:VOC family protein [Photobacterium sanguinicancri]MDO6541947.1 VOC family protein [Photobacterium sanguinicancri]